MQTPAPLYISAYDDKHAKRATHLASKIRWQAALPIAWRSLVISPLWIEVFRDAPAQSERWVGYDEDEKACFCQHRYQRTQARLEDGHWLEQIDYSEDLVAWRMRDDRWLIHRTILRQVDTPKAYSFYAFSNEMPR